MLKIKYTVINCCLTFLLLTTFFAFCTIIIWTLNPSLVNELDGWVVRTYTSHYKDKLKEAMAEPREQQEDKLIQLIKSLEHIKKRDRLYHVKRQIFLSLINLSMIEKKYNEAIYWTERWVDFDEKDLVAKLKKAQILYSIPGRKDEGRLILENLYHRYPDVKKISDNYKIMMKIN